MVHLNADMLTSSSTDMLTSSSTSFKFHFSSSFTLTSLTVLVIGEVLLLWLILELVNLCHCFCFNAQYPFHSAMGHHILHYYDAEQIGNSGAIQPLKINLRVTINTLPILGTGEHLATWWRYCYWSNWPGSCGWHTPICIVSMGVQGWCSVQHIYVMLTWWP